MEMFEQAVETVINLFSLGTPVVCATSFGKDSSAVLAIALEAGVRAKRTGMSPKIVVTHADTTIENPSVRQYADKEIEKLNRYAVAMGLDVDVKIAKPSLSEGWAVRVLSGRAMPSFPGTNADCSTSWKVLPMEKVVKGVFGDLKAKTGIEPVTLIGTRFDESVNRGKSMAERKESSQAPVRNKSGNLILSVICEWTESDVYEFIGEVMNGRISTYSDFADLYELYKDGAGGGCVIQFMEVEKKNVEEAKKSGGCGARFGCYLCTKVKDDKSLDSMIEQNHEKYGFMEGLNKFRTYLIKTRWDFDKRSWLGRSIQGGHIAIRPDSYSAQFCLDLLRMCLTLDAKERVASARAGVAPRFQIVTFEALVMIDAIWSLQAMHAPFQALREWRDIMELGMRYEVPDVAESKRMQMPETRYLKVGKDWDGGEFFGNGLSSAVAAACIEDGWSGGCMGHKTVSAVSKDETRYLFSEDFESLETMPKGSVVGVPGYEDVLRLSVTHPGLVGKVAKGKAADLINEIERGALRGAIIPGSKLSKVQKQMATGIAEESIVDSGAISVLDAEQSDVMDVSEEGAELVLAFEMDELLRRNRESDGKTGLTEGYRWWIQMGVLSVSHSQLRKIDTILRRSSFKERQGLAGCAYSKEDLIERSVTKSEFEASCIAGMGDAEGVCAEFVMLGEDDGEDLVVDGPWMVHTSGSRQISLF